MIATEAEDLSMSRSMDDGDDDAERDEFREDLDDFRWDGLPGRRTKCLVYVWKTDELWNYLKTNLAVVIIIGPP